MHQLQRELMQKEKDVSKEQQSRKQLEQQLAGLGPLGWIYIIFTEKLPVVGMKDAYLRGVRQSVDSVRACQALIGVFPHRAPYLIDIFQGEAGSKRS